MKPTIRPCSEFQPSHGAIRLLVNQLVPNLKNTKRIGHKRLLTAPDVKQAMHEIVQSFASQLLSGIQTSADATLTAQQVYSLTQSLPHDDCWTVIPDLRVTAELADTDGATIWIERL